MKSESRGMNRRQFLTTSGMAVAGSVLASPLSSLYSQSRSGNKMKVAIVGTGSRGTGMWGSSVQQAYGRDYVDFVGLCDPNEGRVEYAKNYIGADCDTFTNFEQMMRRTKPDKLIVTTVDAYHHEYIIKGMEMGADIITEKPMTTDEKKTQAIIDAQEKTGRDVIVTFNYRYSPHRQKIKELLMNGRIGKLQSVDFHWYLDVYHGADYYRRWHGLREKGGTLLVHKSAHHFDLLNWWLDTDPEIVSAFGALDVYGSNGPFRDTNCRPCPHKDECDFYWDITDNSRYMDLYVANEEYDGYLRDGCVYRNEIDIYDKRSLAVQYANGVTLSYSLYNYAPYEGYRIAFNGTEGRIDAWIKEREPWPTPEYDEIRVTENFSHTELIRIPHGGGGHGGGDTRLKDSIFKDPNAPDPMSLRAGTRDGAMAILPGIAADHSIQQNGAAIKIGDLTSLQPMAKRPRA